MSKTKTWYVQYAGIRFVPSKHRHDAGIPTLLVRVSERSLIGSMKFRTITARAAARRFIRNNLPVTVYVGEDGYNEPDDLRPTGRYGKKYSKGMRKRYNGMRQRAVIETVK